MLKGYYVYAYIRSQSSKNGCAGSPYYIGKGKGRRLYEKHGIRIPTDRKYIVVLEQNLSEIGALALERRLIKWWGRINTNTGILRNLTDGGEGSSGAKIIHSPESNAKRSATLKGRQKGPNSSEHNKNISRSKKGKIGKPQSEESKLKNSLSNKGRIVSKETGKKISLAKIGKPCLQKIVECPHCQKTGGNSNMKRFHFDNCKSK
jgi:hypothetical protein